MKNWIVMLGVALAICVFQFAGTASVSATDTDVVIAAAENPTDEAAPEEGTAVEKESADEEVKEGEQPATEQEAAPPATEEETKEEKHKSE